MSNWYDYDITSEYGMRVHPITKENKMHNGVDYAVPSNTSIKSNIRGTVITSDYDEDGYGNYVVIKDNNDMLHYYAHLNKRNVNVGDTVNLFDVIGLSGSTGMSTGPHLHYEVRNSNNQSVNPSKYTTGTYTLEGIYGSVEKFQEEQTNEFLNSGLETTSLQDKLKGFLLPTFKYIIIIILLVLVVIFLTKSLDIEIL